MSLDGLFAKAGQVVPWIKAVCTMTPTLSKLKKTFKMLRGLTATSLCAFEPNQSNIVWGKLKVLK
jgi:hypothetical protein